MMMSRWRMRIYCRKYFSSAGTHFFLLFSAHKDAGAREDRSARGRRATVHPFDLYSKQIGWPDLPEGMCQPDLILYFASLNGFNLAPRRTSRRQLPNSTQMTICDWVVSFTGAHDYAD
jgi:hypothetical protein